jgi:hypothetical protein
MAKIVEISLMQLGKGTRLFGKAVLKVSWRRKRASSLRILSTYIEKVY